jgi:hypothetical protein
VYKFGSLTEPLRGAAKAARLCYEVRRDYDSRSAAFKRHDAEQEDQRREEAELWDVLREHATDLKRRRENLAAQIPVEDLLSNNLSAGGDSALDAVEAVLLKIEKQKLMGMLGVISHIDPEVVRLQEDVEDIRDETVRHHLGGAVSNFVKALVGLHEAWGMYADPRCEVIDQELKRLNVSRRECGEFVPYSRRSSSFESDDTDSLSVFNFLPSFLHPIAQIPGLDLTVSVPGPSVFSPAATQGGLNLDTSREDIDGESVLASQPPRHQLCSI